MGYIWYENDGLWEASKIYLFKNIWNFNLKHWFKIGNDRYSSFASDLTRLSKALTLGELT